VFCKIAAKEVPSQIIHEDEACLAFLDAAPAARGHVLIIPKQHCATVFEMDPGLCGKLHQLVPALARRLRRALGVTALNVLQNNGEAAGQTVGHYHVHLIPRQPGDGLSIAPPSRDAAPAADLAALGALLAAEEA
jgi:histidine triad (HIT) family protein